MGGSRERVRWWGGWRGRGGWALSKIVVEVAVRVVFASIERLDGSCRDSMD